MHAHSPVCNFLKILIVKEFYNLYTLLKILRSIKSRNYHNSPRAKICHYLKMLIIDTLLYIHTPLYTTCINIKYILKLNKFT